MAFSDSSSLVIHMAKQSKSMKVLTDEVIINKIYSIRKQKVILDKDLAELYQVSTGRLNEQVKRNINRFPIDFMFQLTEDEFKNLISQFAIASWGGRRNLPYAFTEHGVLMLSSVLSSETAISVNIQIMRIYTRMRKLILSNREILLKLEQLEGQCSQNKVDIQNVFDYLKQMLVPVEQVNRRRIGYARNDEN
jgi:hypothetical protein